MDTARVRAISSSRAGLLFSSQSAQPLRAHQHDISDKRVDSEVAHGVEVFVSGCHGNRIPSPVFSLENSHGTGKLESENTVSGIERLNLRKISFGFLLIAGNQIEERQRAGNKRCKGRHLIAHHLIDVLRQQETKMGCADFIVQERQLDTRQDLADQEAGLIRQTSTCLKIRNCACIVTRLPARDTSTPPAVCLAPDVLNPLRNRISLVIGRNGTGEITL